MTSVAANFKIKISGILVDLKAKDTKKLMFQCDVAGLKKFQSQVAVDSVSTYDFNDQFEMSCLVAVDQLVNMKLKWILSDSSKMFDNIVGSATVDLLTVATGPMQQTVVLSHHGDTAIGSITFWVMMTQCTDVKVTLKELHVDFIDRADTSCSYYISALAMDHEHESKATKTECSKHTSLSHEGRQLKWKRVETLQIDGAVPHQLADTNLFIKVRSVRHHNREMTVADAKIPLLSILSKCQIKGSKSIKDMSTASMSLSWTVELKKCGTAVGSLTLSVQLDGVPMVVQQIKGLNKDPSNPNPYSGYGEVGRQDMFVPSRPDTHGGGSVSKGSSAVPSRATPQWGGTTATLAPRHAKQVSEGKLLALVKARKDVEPVFDQSKQSTLEKSLLAPTYSPLPSPRGGVVSGGAGVGAGVAAMTLITEDEDQPAPRVIRPLNNVKSFAIIRAILCLYSNSTPKPSSSSSSSNMDERTVGPLLRDAFGITQEQYDEVSVKILEYSPKLVTKAELQLRYAWRDNHPLYRSEGFRDPNGHEKWKNEELNDIAALLADSGKGGSDTTSTGKNGKQQQYPDRASPTSQKPTVSEIFGATLKRHTLNARNSADTQGSDIHKGYKELVKAFVEATMGETPSSNNNRFMPMKEDVLPSGKGAGGDAFNIRNEFGWILREYCTLYGIREFYRHLVVFSLLCRRFDDSLAQLNALFSTFGRLMELRKSHAKTITINEESRLHKSCLYLVEQLRHRIAHYRLCFKAKESNARLHKHGGSSLAMVLRLLDRVVKGMDWHDVQVHSLVAAGVVECSEKEYNVHRTKYEFLLQQQEGRAHDQCLEIFTLSLTMADICQWLKVDHALFNPTMNSYLRSGTTHIELVIETFVKLVRADLSRISSKFMHVDVKKNTGMQTPPWLTGILVELVPHLNEFNNQCQQYVKKNLLPLDQNLSFFSGNFVLNSVCLLERYIEAIIAKQQWTANGNNVLHTSAPIDLFTYIWQCFKSIQVVEEKLHMQSYRMLLKSFGAQLDNTFYLFIKGLRADMMSSLSRDHQQFIMSTIDKVLSEHKKPSSIISHLIANKPVLPNQPSILITSKMCLQLNDIEEARGLLDEFDAENGDIFGNCFRDIYKYLKFQWKSLLAYFCYMMDYKLKPLIVTAAFGKDSSNIDLLLDFLESHIKVCYITLYPSLFKKFLKYLFKTIVLNIMAILLPKSYNKKVWNIGILDNLDQLVVGLIQLFNVSNEGLTLVYIKKELRRPQSTMELFSFSVDQLKTYYRMLVESHKLMGIPLDNNNNNRDGLSSPHQDCLKVMEYFKDDKDMDSFLKKQAKLLLVK
ncbi:hypothetical protein SAMD00019534_006000 [Acytostelium subglobosum LB1]|uniref:hypothetical protein n=1 Tax=Acytostelium subglobosum LB1 TaxID=1410327 RepID=UPI000644B56A|nr:hypothetical protein SAMD00019534_006000 [Acytostelium subglobosum LB1]GAM17425.1 hypothetical protein SAMD00019534_006000 [Acytostelium subglobosum LB1]|eukprot:XP_012759487.1 hypothetical protein SAMD00019534_006000 [Acytostelium subglobosum LB1]